MAISELKITAEDTVNKKISDIEGDTLVGTPSANKAKFDDYPELIKERFNDLVDSLADYLTSSGVGQGSLSDTLKVVLETGAEYYIPKLDTNNKINSDYIYDATTSQKGLLSATDKAKLNQLKVAVDYVGSGTTNPPTSNAVYDAIETASWIPLTMTDYIIYDDTVSRSGIDWRVRKWSNGIIEAYGILGFSFDGEGWTAQGAGYVVDVGQFSLPSAFSGTTKIAENATLINANGDLWLGYNYVTGQAQSQTKTGSYQLYRFGTPSGGEGRVEIAYHVISQP